MRTHKRKEKEEKEEEEEEEKIEFPKPTASTQPTPQIAPPHQQYFVVQAPQPDPPAAAPQAPSFQPAPSGGDGIMNLITAFLSSPAGEKLLSRIFGEKEDPLEQMAYQQMLEAWQTQHQVGKKVLEALAVNVPKAHAKGIEEFLKTRNKELAKKLAEKENVDDEDDLKTLLEYFDDRIRKLEKRIAKKKKKKAVKVEAEEQAPQEQPKQVISTEMQQQPGVFIE